MAGVLDEHTIVEKFDKWLSVWYPPEIIPFKFDEDTEVYGRVHGNRQEIYLGEPQSKFDFGLDTGPLMVGGRDDWFVIRTLRAKHKDYKRLFTDKTIFEFTISVKKGLHTWSDNRAVDAVLDDEESKAFIRSFIGKAAIVLRGQSKIDYIKTRKLKEN